MTHSVPGQDGCGGTPEARRPEVADLYELLEISPRASQDVIQAAYRALVRKYHPDLNASAEAAQRIRTLNAAYRVLSDRQDRVRYDFESARARRYERVAYPERRDVVTTLPASRQTRVAPLHRAAIGRHADGGPILSGQVLLGLLVVGALALVVIALIMAVTFDPSSEYRAAYTAPMIELMGQ